MDLNFEKSIEVRGEDGLTTVVSIKIGEHTLDIFVSEEESNKEYNKYPLLGDDDFSKIDVIIALRKLTNFLENSIDIDIFTEKINKPEEGE